MMSLVVYEPLTSYLRVCLTFCVLWHRVHGFVQSSSVACVSERDGLGMFGGQSHANHDSYDRY